MTRGGEQRIAAEAATCSDTVRVQLHDDPVIASVLPESVLRYVQRTRESLLLNDAVAKPPFAVDPYIRDGHPRSILCVPLIDQTKLTGVLYLENRLTSHAFTADRIALLELLAAQAAVSLENTRLYSDLQEREAKIRSLVDADIIGICIWKLEGEIVEANEAFLHLVDYTREDLVSGGIRWAGLTPTEWRDRDKRAMAEVFL